MDCQRRGWEGGTAKAVAERPIRPGLDGLKALDQPAAGSAVAAGSVAEAVLHALGEGVAILDAQQRFVYVNPAGAALWGRPASEFLGQSFFDFVQPEDFPKLVSALPPLAPAGPSRCEVRLSRRNGPAVPVLVTATPGEAVAQPQGALLVITAMGDCQQAQDQLRLLACALDATPNGLVITDRQARVVYCNPAFLAITGYAAADLRGQPLSVLKSGVQPPAVYEALWTTILAGHVWRGELVNRRKTGDLYTQEIVIAPIRAEDDMITHFVAVVQDISQRKQNETALRQSEEKYRLLVENSSEGITMTDERGRVVEWSVAQEQITGLGRPAVLGRPWWDVIADMALPERRSLEQRQALRTILERALTNGQMPWAYLYRTMEIQRPDGARRTVEAVSYPIQTDGGWLLCGIMRDVTDRLQAELAVRQLNQDLERRVHERTSQLEAANAALEAERERLADRVTERTADLSAANAELARAARAKDEFLANISHELRTPLNTVLGLAEVLQEGGFGPLGTDQLEAAHNIEESGRHLLSLINDVLDISKIEAGRLQLQGEPLDVAAVCQASVRLVREAAQRKGLQLSVVVDPDVTELVADQRRLKQMLVNLLGNACKFTPEGGRIGLEVAGEAADDCVCFTVWDTGIGIAPDDQPRLFQPFVQLDSRLARQYAGTGLGLSLVRHMAEMHGGGVSLTSAPGAGSRFMLRLPWRRPAAEPEAADAPAGLPWTVAAAVQSLGRPPVVLLADDNEANLQVLCRYLAGFACRLVVARTGPEVLARAAELRPDVVILDVQLPELDGLEVARRLRAQAGRPAMAIIVLTALAMAGDRERCLAAGADDYLSKPVSGKAFLAAFAAQLRRAAAGDQ